MATAFDQAMQLQAARLDRLEEAVLDGESRLLAPNGVRRQIEDTQEEMRSMFPDAKLVVTPPRQGLLQRWGSVARYWMIRSRHQRSVADSFWSESTQPPEGEFLVPLDPKRRRAWEQRRAEMVNRELPVVRAATDRTDRESQASRHDREHLVERRRRACEIVLPGAALTRTRRRSFGERLGRVFNTGRLAVFREKFETTTTPATRHVEELNSVLAEPLPDLGTTQAQLKKLEREVSSDWPRLLDELQRIDPNTW